MAISSVGTINEYNEALRQASGYYDWYEALTKNYQRTLTQTNQKIEQQANYDISQAYSNYLNQQKILYSNPNISSGDLDRINASAYGNYTNAYKYAKQQEAVTKQETFSKIQSAYQKEITDKNKQFEKLAEEYRKLDEYALSFAETKLGLGRDKFSPNALDRKANYYKIFDYFDEEGGFADFLYSQGETELYDLYKQDVELAKGVLGGENLENMYNLSLELEKIKNNITIDSDLSEISDMMKDYDKSSEEYKYLESKKSNIESVLNNMKNSNEYFELLQYARSRLKKYPRDPVARGFYEIALKILNRDLQEKLK